ncbi:MAG TPA: hypothetical protein VHT91_46550 [Kofleriaceae bacterium]|jgi:hypothetical protein|nr:hypothetical protein [Kofleriaceae bacterium]
MSRDRRDRPERNDPAARAGTGGADGAATPPDPGASADLLTAYVDGVAELPVDERRTVERWLADDPAARADADAVHDLLGRLRALPPTYDTGEPPDWAAMERSIRQAVADQAPVPWWRRWRWLVPAMTCTTAAAIAIALWPRSPVGLGSAPAPGPAREAALQPGREPPPGEDVVPLWLDGSEVDVDLSRPGAPGAIDQVLGTAGGPTAHADEPGNEAGNEIDAASPVDEIGLLPAAGMAWIDDLDDAALDRAERLLARPPGPDHPAPTGPARSKG